MKPFVSLKTEHFDIGQQHLAILSPVNCNVTEAGQPITNASVHFYDLESEQLVECWDLETVLRETSTEAWKA